MKNFICSVAITVGVLLFAGNAFGQKAIKVARSADKAKPRAAADAKTTAASAAVKPIVIMSSRHKATCLKVIGDKIGNVEVTDITKSNHKLSELLSDKLTVLIFWQEQSLPAMEQFRRIPVEILGSYAKHRVKVITANVGGGLEQTRKITGDAADKIVSLVDSDSKLFQQFAKSHIPRTYLLDKDGKILWFDMEYSKSTRRELNAAIDYYLAK